ncbi:uncharacterized protein LOC123694876 [Colias croceus]|uniref:uncharacterized protein LOC123694876 n=1 Tax=Colias crocea TaxID=72248 RepID=UPI001E27DB75|nr:uncharacterized protein LOC123694876 [Colias croceus]
MADSLAKSATQVGCNTHFSNYSQDLVPLSKLRLDGKWLNLWQESSRTKGKFYWDIQPIIPHKPWFFRFRKFDKLVTSTICRLRFGHACTPVHLAKIRVRDHSICECGLDEAAPS